MTARNARPRALAAVLHVDFGQCTRDGRWLSQPSARYECYRCGGTEGPVTGPHPVASFVEHVKRVHATRCATPPAADAA
ncbi:hypothetical protein ACIOC1_00270 [Streptomyces sp. NPDC088197]|uniref:hypothetical protein n=1 Tax=Streptomyces sp. NPDC088197 TaxID=3365840 RepID=UPI00381595F0